ncbi:MAG: 7-cyano-7-deazaguanine synthase [Victivallaceae bacterium]|nr:7-cyano-7-deazaguanine synthase [Victivallaceae bacterium]
MRNIVCAPRRLIPSHIKKGTKYISTYAKSRRKNVGYFAPTLIKDVKNEGLRPTVETWDFTTIALSVATADNSISRKESADGWTREIDLTIHLCSPSTWEPVKEALQNTLRFLTGDFWSLTFEEDGDEFPRHHQLRLWGDENRYENMDSVCLLSGGVDSLVGAIDLTSDGKQPIFVSQTVRGDAEAQRHYANAINANSSHFQWSHKIHHTKGESEGSTRGRSIIFFAFAALAASAITPPDGAPVNIYVPENGFISLNIPLNPGRIGSFSTKTTHPVYMKGLQSIWDKLGMNIKLITPYKFKTKGEILSECKDRSLLESLIGSSTSCGKYTRHGFQHCGRCVPCMVRRAAFLKAQMTDNTTKGYKFDNLSSAGLERGPNDVGAMTTACLNIDQRGIKHVIAGNLSFAERDEKSEFEGIVTRGFKEIEHLLNENIVI